MPLFCKQTKCLMTGLICRLCNALKNGGSQEAPLPQVSWHLCPGHLNFWPRSHMINALFALFPSLRLKLHTFCLLPKWSFYIIRQAPRRSCVFFIMIQIMWPLVVVIMRQDSRHSAKKHSWLWITLQTSRLIRVIDRTTITAAAHCLGVIPRFKGLTGKDYQQLPFSLELVINQTTHFRVSFQPGAHAPVKIWMKSTKLFKSDPLRTNGFSPSPQKQRTLQEALQGSERSHENSAPSISSVAGFFVGFNTNKTMTMYNMATDNVCLSLDTSKEMVIVNFWSTKGAP